MTKTRLKDLTIEEITKRLQNGEVAKDGHGGEYKCINGLFCYLLEYGNENIYYTINTTLSSDCIKSFYFETPDPITIELYKPYKTRGGDKVVFFDNGNIGKYPFSGVLDCGVVNSWSEDGKYNIDGENDLDIVGEWTDD